MINSKLERRTQINRDRITDRGSLSSNDANTLTRSFLKAKQGHWSSSKNTPANRTQPVTCILFRTSHFLSMRSDTGVGVFYYYKLTEYPFYLLLDFGPKHAHFFFRTEAYVSNSALRVIAILHEDSSTMVILAYSLDRRIHYLLQLVDEFHSPEVDS